MHNWTVDQALDEIKDHLRTAVTPLTVNPHTLQTVDDRLRPSFQDQQQANANADWNKDRQKVLGLVRLAGSVAATLTLLDWAEAVKVGNARPPAWPTEVRENDVLAAIHLIATEICVSAGYCKEERTLPSPATKATLTTFAKLERLVVQARTASDERE